jgi:hypothetical protein
MTKSTTYLEAKFIDHTRLLKNSFFKWAVAAYCSGFDVVVKGVTEPVESITGLEMKWLDFDTVRPDLVASLSQVAG